MTNRQRRKPHRASVAARRATAASDARAGLFDKMLTADGATMTFNIDREPTDGKTFSKEGFDDLTDAMALWVGSRLKKTVPEDGRGWVGPGPSHMSVRVSVNIEGHRFPDTQLEPDYTITSGAHRRAGTL